MGYKTLEKYLDGALMSSLCGVWPEPFGDIDDLRIPTLREPLIYHYTDVEGVKGIIESNCLWASAAQFLNDSSEIEYGHELVRTELDEWVRINDGRKTFGAGVLFMLWSRFSASTEKLPAAVYVTCFCESGNLLSQWRAYGQAGGYSLGFAIEDSWPTISLTPKGSYWETRLQKVIYSVSEQKRRISSVLRKAYEAMDAHRAPSPVEAASLLMEVTDFIYELLLDEIATFKNPAFEEEREWRLVVRRRWIDFGEDKNPDPAPKFRRSRGSLVPYLELRPGAPTIPLRSIRFGPSLERKRVETPLRLLLSSCGFGPVDIEGSDLPVVL
jgi:DUF2971 family protein